MVALAPNTSEASTWDVVNTFPKLHSRAREVKTTHCAEVPESKSLSRVEIWLLIYESCDGLESFTRDPIGFEGSEWNLYEVMEGMVLDGLDPTGLTLVSRCEDDCAKRYPNWYQYHLYAGCISGCQSFQPQICWWDCMVKTNKCALTQLCAVASCVCTTGFTHWEVAKGSVRRGVGTPGDLTTLQSKLALKLRQSGYCGTIRGMARAGAHEASANMISSGCKSCVAGVLAVEAVVSIYCGFKCS